MDDTIPIGDEGGTWTRVCSLADLADLDARGFMPHPKFAIFVLVRDGELHAYRDLCPHYGRTRLAWKHDAYMTGDKTRILCSAHGAEFDPSTGKCVIGPCLGQSLSRVPARVGSAEHVEIWVPEAPSATL